MPQRSSNQKKFDISAVWSCGPRTSQWDRLWVRLLSYALEPSLQPPETRKTNCGEVSSSKLPGTTLQVPEPSGDGEKADGQI